MSFNPDISKEAQEVLFGDKANRLMTLITCFNHIAIHQVPQTKAFINITG